MELFVAGIGTTNHKKFNLLYLFRGELSVDSSYYLGQCLTFLTFEKVVLQFPDRVDLLLLADKVD